MSAELPQIGQASMAVSQPRPAPQPGKSAEAVRATAKQFESVFISQMLQHMFEGIKTDGTFGGGHGEEMFRSMMLDEYGKMIANQGNGIGIASAVERSLLLQAQEVH